MVKKAKPAKAAAEQDGGKPKKAKKSSQGGSAPTSVKAGLMQLMLPAMLGSALAVAICGVLMMFVVIQPGATQQMSIYGSSQAQHYLDDLLQAGQNYRSWVQQVANSSLTRSAFSGSNEQIKQVEQQLTTMFPSASTIRIFRKGKARKDPSTIPPVSFAQLDMVARAEDKNNASPEIHQHDKQSYLSVAVAIKEGERTMGSLLISVDLKIVRKNLPVLPAENGYVEIIQTFSGQEKVVYSSGDQSHKQGSGYLATGSVPHWSARYYPAASKNVMAGKSSMIWILVAVAVVLVLVFSATSYVLLNRALQHNAMALAAFFQARTQKEDSNKPFTLGIFASLAQTIARMFDEFASKQAKNLGKARPSDNSEQVDAEMPDFDPTYHSSSTDVLDLELDGDDDDLLSAAAEIDHGPLDIQQSEPDPAPLEMVNHNVKIAPEIFRAYDIRGVVGETLTAEVAYAIGAAAGTEAKSLGQDAILVARDGRHSSQELADSLMQGIQSTGCNVQDLGMVPTPVLYFATKTQNTQSGIMVTGSHNPPQYNGFKIVINDETLALDRIQALRQRLEQGQVMRGQGEYEAIDVSQSYLERICSDVVLAKPMRIVVDTGNGVAGPLTCQLLEALGCTVSPLFTEIDGNFPNHHPDPSNPDNLQELIRTVQAEGAELGLAIDGDGDRLGLVTPSGKIIWPDRMLMLYARDLLARNPGADILYDVKCTRDVAELVSNLGGRAIMCATGHSLMKAKMKDTGAVVGGELSGHIFFNDRWYGFDDALYSAARLLEILSMEPFEAEQVFAEFPEKVSTPELHIPVTDASKFKIMEKLVAKGNFEGGNLVKVDGVRVDFPDSWGLVRASNTTPVLVARFEGDTEEALEKVKSVFREQLSTVEPSLNVSF